MNSSSSNLSLLNQFFDRIYLVTIPRSWEARKDKIQQNLSGLNYTLFDGCDGRALSKTFLNENVAIEKAAEWMEYYHLFRYNTYIHRTLTPSEIGCSESHRMVYQDILNKGYNNALILEDDAMIWKPGLDAFKKSLESLPDDWDVWYLGYRWHDCESPAAKLKRKILLGLKLVMEPSSGKKELSKQKVFYPKKISRHIWKAGFHAGTHAYAVTGKSAKTLLEENTPIYLAADILLAHLYLNGKLNSYISVPQVFREDQSFKTTILNQ